MNLNQEKLCQTYNNLTGEHLTVEELEHLIDDYIMHHVGEKYDGSEYMNVLNNDIGALMYEYNKEYYSVELKSRIAKLLIDAKCFKGDELAWGISQHLMLDNGYKSTKELDMARIIDFSRQASDILAEYVSLVVILDLKNKTDVKED